MRILFLSEFRYNKPNWGFELFKKDFARLYDVKFYGKYHTIGYDKMLPITEVVKLYNPDLIFVQFSQKYMQGLEYVKNIPKIHLMGDYNIKLRHKAEKYLRYLHHYKFDIIFTNGAWIKTELEKEGFRRVYFIPFGVDTSVYKDYGYDRDMDVSAMFASNKWFYPYRRQIKDMINSLNLHTYTKNPVWYEYIDMLNRSKITVNSGSYMFDVVMRYTEAMACGTLFMTDKPHFMRLYGYKPSKHLILFDGIDDLRDKIGYYISHDYERESIAKCGKDFVVGRYSNDVIIHKMMNIVEGYYG